MLHTNEAIECLTQYQGEVLAEIEIYEEHDNGVFAGQPHTYVQAAHSVEEAKDIEDVLWQAIEVECLDNMDILVEMTLYNKDGEYIDRDEAVYRTTITRTKQPSAFIVWRNKMPNIFRIDKENSRLEIVNNE